MAVEELNNAYTCGGAARASDQPMSDNPFAFDTPQYGSWHEGWMHMDEHMQKKEAALDSIGWFG